jgi:acetyl/propionyl-CoA carboxylase alpha subunit
MEITSVLDIQRLLDTIFPASPCGDDLEYDAAFLELECAAQGQPERQMGDAVLPTAAMLKAITRPQLERIKKRVESGHKVACAYDDSMVELIVSRCTDIESGERMIDAILTNTLLPDMYREFLTRMLKGKPLAGVHVSQRDNALHYVFETAD